MRVEPAAVQCKFDTGTLGYCQVRTLTHHLGPQSRRIDAKAVIRPISGFRLAFVRGFHVGPDPAEPEQVHVLPQQCLDQLLRRHAFLSEPKTLASLWRKPDRLCP